jgi:branched-chain amino acid transport system ATP-binding protein
MLSVGRALAGKSRLLLADEISLGLAPLVVGRLMSAIRAAADQGLAVVLVEQQIRHALVVADRVCILRRGRKVLEGQASELRRLPGQEVERLYLAEGDAPATLAPDGAGEPGPRNPPRTSPSETP